MDNYVVKILVYDKLVTKVNAIDTNIATTSLLIIKAKYDSDKQGFEKKIEDVYRKMRSTSRLVKKTDYNKEITEIDNKIPRVTGLVTTAALNTKAQKLKIKYLILEGWSEILIIT